LQRNLQYPAVGRRVDAERQVRKKLHNVTADDPRELDAGNRMGLEAGQGEANERKIGLPRIDQNIRIPEIPLLIKLDLVSDDVNARPSGGCPRGCSSRVSFEAIWLNPAKSAVVGPWARALAGEHAPPGSRPHRGRNDVFHQVALAGQPPRPRCVTRRRVARSPIAAPFRAGNDF
jgi:hypothetical protein